jgi:DNA topoisomerase-1
VIRLKKEADANRLIRDFADEGIQVLNGRYGPYITDKKKNAKIPKDRDPLSLTLEECRALLAAAPERGRFGRWGRGKRAAAAPAAGAAASAAGGDGAQEPATAAAPAQRHEEQGPAAPSEYQTHRSGNSTPDRGRARETEGFSARQPQAAPAREGNHTKECGGQVAREELGRIAGTRAWGEVDSHRPLDPRAVHVPSSGWWKMSTWLAGR